MKASGNKKSSRFCTYRFAIIRISQVFSVVNRQKVPKRRSIGRQVPFLTSVLDHFIFVIPIMALGTHPPQKKKEPHTLSRIWGPIDS